MATMKPYHALIRHDHGRVKVRTWASSRADAIANIMRHEGCPRRAIEKCYKAQGRSA